MKNLIVYFLALFFTVSLWSCKNHSVPEKTGQPQSDRTPKSLPTETKENESLHGEFKEYDGRLEVYKYTGQDNNTEIIKRVDANSAYRFLYSKGKNQEEIELETIKTIVPQQSYEVKIPGSNEIYQIEIPTCPGPKCSKITMKKDGKSKDFEHVTEWMGNRGIFRCNNPNGEKEYLKVYGFLTNLKAFYCTQKNPQWIELKVSDTLGDEFDQIVSFYADFPEQKPYENFRVEAYESGFSVGYACGEGGSCIKNFEQIGK